VLSHAASPDYSLVEHVTKEECQVALADCLAKGWLQVIDESARSAITDELRESQFVGPIYGLPQVGGVEFTHVGAEMWRRLCRRCFPETRQRFAFTDVVHCKSSRYFRTRAAALKGIEEVQEWDGAITVAGPLPIGPWRAQWWRRFPEGYRIDVDERRQWQGRCGEGEGCFMPDPHRQGADLQRLKHVLDCHNLMLREWLLLASMEHGWCKSAPSLLRWVARSAKKTFWVTASKDASKDECRIGLEACLQYRWLRIVDQHAVDEVEALKREEPAIMPVAEEVWGRDVIDFTPCGAALYRMIAAEWLGPDWENELSVWKESYREEHRYSEAKEGLSTIAQEYSEKGEVIRASKIVPVGPWCVYWWERFAAGYRLELKIGEP
jgi:hypothetical protein